MSNCHSKYLNKIYNKNRKLNIDNEDYVNVFLKIINDTRRRYVYPESILRNKNTNKNGKSYKYFAKRINYILENPIPTRYVKRHRTKNILKNRIRSKIREMNLRKYGYYYSRSFSSLISRL